MSRDITIVLKVQDNFSQPLQQFNTQIGGIATSSTDLTNATEKTGSALDSITKGISAGIVAWAGWKGINAVSDMFQLGQSVNIASSTFSALTAGIGGSAVNLQALREVTGGVVDDMMLMEGSAKMLQMGIAANTDELASMMSMATKLGSSMGMDVTKSLSDFSLMLANNSIMRLDQFGISSGRVREEMEKLKDSFPDMDKGERFKLAVLKEGASALDRLGGAASAAETPMNRVAASIKNIADSFSADFATGVNGLAGILEIASGNNPIQKKQTEDATGNAIAYGEKYTEALNAYFAGTGIDIPAEFQAKILTEAFKRASLNPNMSRGQIAQDVMGSMDYNDTVGMTDEIKRNVIVATASILQQRDLAEQTAKSQQEQAAAQAEIAAQAQLYKAYLATGGGDDRQESLASQQEALEYGKQRHDALMLYNDDINLVGNSLLKITGDSDPMSTMYTAKLSKDQVADMLPHYMTPEGASEVTNAYAMAQDNLTKLHLLADKKLITDDQLTQAENMTSNLGLMADQAQAAADAFKNLTLSQALGQSNGGMQGEIGDMVIQNMKDKGYGKYQIAAMQQELDMQSGRETESSLEVKQVIAPMIAKMTAKQAAQAIANVDAFLKEATLQGLSQEQITAMLPDVVGFEAQGHTRNISQAELDAQRKAWEKTHHQEKKRNKDGSYDYTGRWLDDMGKEASFTPDPNQKVNYTQFTGGADYTQGTNMQRYMQMQMGGFMGAGSGFGGAGSIFDDEKSYGKPGQKSPTAAMAGDMTQINKDSTAIDKNTRNIAESTTLAAKAATTIRDALLKIPDSIPVVFKFTADDPQGLVGLVKALTGGQLTLNTALKERGVPMKHANDKAGV